MTSPPAFAQSVDDLRGLSIDALANIPVTSVSKATEPLGDAAAAIYVISHDDIIRSGATTIPEMLRLAPNLEVAQLNANSYAISARGFNVGNNAALSNKLLVLIDGRSVYTPLFGGVYWDMQAVLPEDIDHIEVISGPGATLWGANAVNGVINIITRNAAATQGGVLTLGGGNLERMASLQYGGRLTDDLAYRVHAEGYEFTNYDTSAGQNGHDSYNKPQGGFRIDWTPGTDQLSVQGDIYGTLEAVNQFLQGHDLLADWRHAFADGSNLQVLAYWDAAGRYVAGGGPGLTLDTLDLEIQHSVNIAGWNNLVWGAGERAYIYDFEDNGLVLSPAARTLNLGNVFAQDTIDLPARLKLTLGIKLEAEPYANIEPMPSVRLAWKAADSVLLWGAVSRAVRAPTPVDADFREFSGPLDALNGSSSFRPENMIAYEAGTRVQASARASLSASTFYDVYDDLRSIEFSTGGTAPYPLYFANLLRGHVYGLEAWGDYQVADWWRLSAGFNIQHENLRYARGSAGLGGLTLTENDPTHQASLRSSINFDQGVTWDADFRWVGRLKMPVVPSYAELNMRLGWQVSSRLDVSITGDNLLHPQHVEFSEPPQSDEIPRSFFVQTRWRF